MVTWSTLPRNLITLPLRLFQQLSIGLPQLTMGATSRILLASQGVFSADAATPLPLLNLLGIAWARLCGVSGAIALPSKKWSFRRILMKPMFLSFIVGLLVGVLYGLIRVKSPARTC